MAICKPRSIIIIKKLTLKYLLFDLTCFTFDRPFSFKIMSPRTQSQLDNLRAERMQLIMDAALKLFANEGYHQTTINKIAAEAGISKGLMYNYFESKEALLFELLHQSAGEYLAFFDPDHDGILTGDELEYYIVKSFDSITADPDFWRLLFRVMLQPRVAEILRKKSYHLSKNMIKLLKAYFERSGFENPRKEVVVFMALVQGGILQYVSNPQTPPLVIRDFLLDRYVNHIKTTDND